MNQSMNMKWIKLRGWWGLPTAAPEWSEGVDVAADWAAPEGVKANCPCSWWEPSPLLERPLDARAFADVAAAAAVVDVAAAAAAAAVAAVATAPEPVVGPGLQQRVVAPGGRPDVLATEPNSINKSR